MNVPYPGGVGGFLAPTSSEELEEEKQSLTPRESVEEEDEEAGDEEAGVIDITTPIMMNQQYQQRNSTASTTGGDRTSAGGASSTSTTNSSTVQAQTNYMSFDDEGNSANYLQFFKSPPSNFFPSQQKHFAFDAHDPATDRTTRTPILSSKKKKRRQQQTTTTTSNKKPPPPVVTTTTVASSLSQDGEVANEDSFEIISDQDDAVLQQSLLTAKNGTHDDDDDDVQALFPNPPFQEEKKEDTATTTTTSPNNKSKKKDGSLLSSLKKRRSRSSSGSPRRRRNRYEGTSAVLPTPSAPLGELYDDENVLQDLESLQEESTSISIRSSGTSTTATSRRSRRHEPIVRVHTDRSTSLIAPSESEGGEETTTEDEEAIEATYSSGALTSSSSDDSSTPSSLTGGGVVGGGSGGGKGGQKMFLFRRGFPTKTFLAGKRGSYDASSQRRHHNMNNDSLSILSSASHLFGESLVSVPTEDGGGTTTDEEAAQSSSQFHSSSSSSSSGSTTPTSRTSSPPISWGGRGGRRTSWLQSASQHVLSWAGSARNKSRQRGRRRTLSPRSRNLSDLQFLKQMHKQKVSQILYNSNNNEMDENDIGGNENDDEDYYDFCLVLQPQNVYGFWAELLDFRVELLGLDVVQAMEEQWNWNNNHSSQSLRLVNEEEEEDEGNDGDLSSSPTSSMEESGGSLSTTTNNYEEYTDSESGCPPSTGLTQRRRNRRRKNTNALESTSFRTPAAAPNAAVNNNNNAFSQRTLFQSQNNNTSRRSLLSTPGIYSVSQLSQTTTTAKKQSVFERAIESPSVPFEATNLEASLQNVPLDDDQDEQPTPAFNNNAAPATIASTVYRRRWGNRVQTSQSIVSPPVRSLPRQRSQTERRPRLHSQQQENLTTPPTSTPQEQQQTTTSSPRDPDVLTMQGIPNQVIARGIAKRSNRTNGLLPFLSALKRGFVVRKHRPGQEAQFCKLFSPDGGDTIIYQAVEHDEAMLALKEQRVRYNPTTDSQTVTPQPWSVESISTTPRSHHANEANVPHNFSVPDYVAADKYRKELAKEERIGRRMTKLATKVVGTGTAKMADLIAVHPARNKDPRSSDLLGTTSLRRSKSDYSIHFSFSLVLRQTRGSKENGMLSVLGDQWHEGVGSDSMFRYLDFEAATEGEYWLVFRGLLLLQRDAVVGRFAKERNKGFERHVDRQQESINSDECNRLHQDEFHEPATVGWLERMIVNCRDLDKTYMEGFVTKDGAIPPPSDYFLGFRSPGTAIWSRLRQAGLETKRVYSLDPNRVMIKIRCPSDRLMDVAEVLRIKLKTKEGSFAAFREDIMDVFHSMDDPLEGPKQGTFQFSSSVRQKIIGFIIGSRIRDSGAELGETTDLGQKIMARAPLHMPGKLNAIYQSWFCFWKLENWRGRSGRSLLHAGDTTSSTTMMDDKLTVESGACKRKNHGENKNPGVLKRFFVGSFYQPLDSIEQYFGEKVAFYFTWLQHTAAHLVVLSVAGLILFFCQVGSGDVDHPLRPLFAVVVMMWTFVVLVNWRKRANFMAYRWGTMNYKEQETTRPQFKGDYTQDEITGEWIVTYPKWKRWLKYCISFPLTLLFTAGTLLLILWVHANRDLQLANYLQTNENRTDFHFDFAFSAIGQKAPIVEVELSRENLLNPEFWIIVVGMPSMLGLFLPLLNFILMRLSVMLNDFENYRTESEYRTYLIIKVFSFRFICYFATLYYYAFVSTGSETAIKNGILRVGTGVLIYTTVAQWWQNVVHVCLPMLIRKLRMNHRQQRLCTELREIELEEEEISRISANRTDEEVKQRQIRLINKRLLLEQAQDNIWLELMQPMHDSFPEYIQAVVQFTFVSCFSVVLPITPVIVLLNYLISMRLDAYKLCRGRRRPLAEKTGGIGVWEHLLHIVAVISVLTNCWLMGFTSKQFTWIAKRVGDLGLFALIVGWEHVMLLIKYVMSASMSPLPRSVRDAMKREQHEVDKQRNLFLHERRKQHEENHVMDQSTQNLLSRRSKWISASSSQENGSTRSSNVSTPRMDVV